MSIDLAFTPSGHLTTIESTDVERGFSASSSIATAGPGIDKAVKAFASCQAEGLFVLATARFEGFLAPSFAYWRDFAVRYLTELCHTPQTADTELDAIAPSSPGRRGRSR